jgi:hypothetical protein
MAAKKKSSRDLPVDPLVRELLAARPQGDLTMLAGFLGPGRTKAEYRLYLSPDLQSWLDLPRSAAVSTRPLPASASPLGGTAVWVPRDQGFHCIAVGAATLFEGLMDVPGLLIERHSTRRIDAGTWSASAVGNADAMVALFGRGLALKSAEAR